MHCPVCKSHDIDLVVIDSLADHPRSWWCDCGRQFEDDDGQIGAEISHDWMDEEAKKRGGR